MKNNKNNIQTTENFEKTYAPFLKRLANIPYTDPEYYVYYDNTGDITLVSPVKDLQSNQKFLIVHYSEIKDIVLGKASASSFYIGDGELKSKESVLRDYNDYLYHDKDSFVDSVDEKESSDLIFQVTDEHIELTIARGPLTAFRRLLNENLVTEENLNISGSKFFTFFVADMTDPNLLVDSYDVPVKDLVVNGKLTFEGNFDWDYMAIYCKQNVETGMIRKENNDDTN